MNIDLGITITGFNNATAPLRAASRDVRNLGENAQAAGNRLKAIQVVIAGILINKTLEYSKALTKVIAEQQALDLRMEAFAGSAKAVNSIMKELNQSFGSAPFKLDTLSQSWVRMRAAVQTNSQVTPILRGIVDSVSAMGGTDENVNNLAQSFQRMFATGVASAREYKSILTQTGLTLGDLAAAAGTSSTELEGSLKNGFLNAQKFADIFVTATTQRFAFFAENLKGTVAGSISGLMNSIDQGISNIGATTDLNARVAAFFQNLARAITDVLNAITQSDIDEFYNWLAKMQPLLVKTVVGIFNISTAVLQLATTVGNWLGSLPSDVLQWGIVGFAIFGKRGAFVLGALAAVKGQVQDFLKWAETHTMTGGEFNGQSMQDRMGQRLPGGGVKIDIGGFHDKSGDNPFLNLLPTKEQIAANQKMVQNLLKGFSGGSGEPEDMSYAMEQALEASTNFADQLNASLATTRERISEMNFKANGDQLGAELSQYVQQGDQFNQQLVNAEVKYSNLKIKTTEATAAIGGMRDIQSSFNSALERGKALATDLYNLATRSLQMQSQLVTMQNDAEAKRMGRESQGGWLGALMGSESGQLMYSVEDQQNSLKQQIIQNDITILDLETQIREVQADPVRVAALNAQVESYNRLKGSTQDALNNLSVEGEMQKGLWRGLGDIITNGLTNAITGLIDGTKSLGDVAREVFAGMISMAIKYMMQLLMLKAIMAFGGLADGGVVPSGVSPFANGGPIQPGGNVKAFANGDIITGPTLFGLAGEAGDEAIMPLTRIGGKLGVRSAGGGGNTYNISISAIDTENGMQFISKHIDGIEGRLAHKRRLNRGT